MKRDLLKKSFGLVLLCSLLLLMVSVSSCQQSKLKAMVAIANKQCPMTLGDIGTITSIIYDGSNVAYTLNMNEEITNITVLKKNPENMKESIQSMFTNPAPGVKEMLTLVVDSNAGLEMIFVGKDSGEKAVCQLSTEELKNILQAETDPQQNERAKLEAQVKMANLQFPMQASDEVVIEKMEIESESVTYICKVDENLCPISQIEENAQKVKEGIVANLAAQTDAATQLFIQICISNNKSVTYRYIGSESGSQYDIVVGIPELKKMIIEK